MSEITTHERPGVYSVYSASSVVSGTPGGGVAALVSKSPVGTPGQIYDLGSVADAKEKFGSASGMAVMTELLMVNGASRVLAAPVKTAADYQTAFSKLAAWENIKAVVCDSTDLEIQQALRDSVEEASQARRERIAVICGEAEDTVAALTERAGALNSERMVLVAPACQSEDLPVGQVAAAVAGAICGGSDPAIPLGGAALRGIQTLAAQLSESDVDALVRGGVTPLEFTGGRCVVIRGVTTRTKTNGTADATWRELTTVLVVDDVIPAVRQALQARFYRTKNTAQVRGAVRSQVLLELERKKAAEIITDYGEVTVEALEDNPTVCLVTFSFTAAHGLNQIWLSAQITV